jgi:hypothetical protein
MECCLTNTLSSQEAASDVANAAEEKRSGLISSVKGAVSKVRGKAGKAVDSATGRVHDVYDTSKVRHGQYLHRAAWRLECCVAAECSRRASCCVALVVSECVHCRSHLPALNEVDGRGLLQPAATSPA